MNKTYDEIRALVLTDIEKDKFIYRENSYRIKQYAYHNFNYVDEYKKPIKERVFSFILWKGNSWDNSTHLNLKESELHTVLDRYKAIIAEKKAERKHKLTIERSIRKQLPRYLQWRFKNVVITLIESPCYYSQGYVNPYRGFFAEDEKHYDIYANDMPFRYCSGKVPVDFEFTTQWVLEHIAKAVVAKYNVNKLKDIRKRRHGKTVVIEKFNYNFVPYHFYIGYAINFQNELHAIYNVHRKGFETDKGSIDFPIQDLHTIDVVGELDGMQAFVALKNKYNYVE